MRQSEKLAALGQLVSGVAHELNNPLAAILHFAEDLLDDERSAADLEALSVIRDQARRSRTIVRDLLSFVRFRDAARERVSLTEALGASVKALQPTVLQNGGRLMSSLPEAEIFGNTDRAGLQQIVTNLVLNAAQASGRGGVVTVRAVVTEQELAIIIEDTGPGIPPALMDRIFEPFFTTKPLGEGTGLGLSVTLGIVQQLGGRIEVENRGPDEGSGARFTVTLPIDGVAVTSPIAGDRRSMVAASPIEHKAGSTPASTRADHRRRAVDSSRASPLLHATRLAGGRSARRRRRTRTAAGGEVGFRGGHLRSQDAGLLGRRASRSRRRGRAGAARSNHFLDRRRRVEGCRGVRAAHAVHRSAEAVRAPRARRHRLAHAPDVDRVKFGRTRTVWFLSMVCA